MHEILVADNDPSMRQLFTEILSLRGDCSVVAVAQGRTALTAAGERNLRLIVVDWDLPDLHPFDLYAQLRLQPGGRTIPVLFITGDPESLQPAALAGPYACLSKPFHLSDLDEQVSALLGRTRRRTARRDEARRWIA
jgi:CheY-like chemotaxis protein